MPSLNLPGCRISFSTPDAEASALELNGDRTRCLVKCTSAWLYAHLLPDDLAEARLKLAYDFPHAAGAQDFDVSGICRNRGTDPEY